MSDVQINNKVFLSGKVITNPVFTHEVMGEGFYEVMLAVKRMSEQEDVIPVTLSERLMIDNEIRVGDTLSVDGQFRSYNKYENGKSRLMLTVFTREIADDDEREVIADLADVLHPADDLDFLAYVFEAQLVAGVCTGLKKPTYADGVHKGNRGRRRRKKSHHHRTYGLRLQAHRISHDSVQARNMRRAYRGQPRLQQIRLYPVHCVGQERALCGKFGSGR